MPLDAICVSAVADELDFALKNAKIEKIHQPEKDEINFLFRGRLSAKRLVVSASANHPRINLTEELKENPAAPPMFCMLLRKLLASATIESITQIGLERAVKIEFNCYDEFGYSVKRYLVCEFIGRCANIILVDNENRIVDAVKRVDFDMSEQRQILPGLIYRVPPTQNKINPFESDIGEFRNILKENPEKAVDKLILNTYTGISPLVSREIVFRAVNDTTINCSKMKEVQIDKLIFTMKNVFEKKPEPFAVIDHRTNKPVDFSYIDISQYGTLYLSKTYATFSEMLDDFYAKKDNAERIAQRSQEMLKTISNAYDRIARKLAVQNEELKATAERERLRELGDILSANIYNMKKGQKEVIVQDFYDPNGNNITISLSEKLSPQQNAQKYYKDYNKLKSAEKMLVGLISNGEKELSYLETVLDSLSRAENVKDLEEIRDELSETGYYKKRNIKNKKETVIKKLPSIDVCGCDVYIGKNNKQNDFLTTKFADKSDLWLHVQKMPGAHVIIQGGADDKVLEAAAAFAAFYSKGAKLSKVNVDYTIIKNVKKPNGAKPGYVIYDNYKTITVEPRKPGI